MRLSYIEPGCYFIPVCFFMEYQCRKVIDPSKTLQVCANLREADMIVYGMGSLYTSIAPSLVLRGVGEAVADRECPKVLLLNGCHDRETSLCLNHEGPMHAVCFLLPELAKRCLYCCETCSVAVCKAFCTWES